jgi:hypothetical protein
MIQRGVVIGIVAAALAGAAVGSPPAPLSQGAISQGPVIRDSLTLREHCSGTLSYRTSAGVVKTVRVSLRQWVANGRAKVARFPQAGFLVVQLSSGKVVTVINGEKRERKPDEFWTVPASAVMRVETGNEQAALEVLAIQER